MAADPASAQGFLQSVPAVVWTGIAGAVMTLIGTLGGVIATNWGNTKRLQLQLDHDTTEKAKERLATLRRELYLKAAEANVRGLAYFGSLPQADFTKPDADAPIRNVLAIGAQLQLVVNQGTAQLISDLISAYGELQFKLLPKVMPIHNLRTDINIRDQHYESTQVEIKRVLAAMKEHNESGRRDPERFETLSRAFTFAGDTADAIVRDRAALWDQMNALQRQFMRDLIPDVKRLGELQIHAMVEMRRELDVGGDVEVFRLMMRRQWERMDRALDEFDGALFGSEKSASRVPENK